jgi:hypothetical protein
MRSISRTLAMRRLRPSTSETAVIVALAAGAYGLTATSSAQAPDPYIPAQHPTAVLAWAQTRCPAAGTLKPGAPRAHAEDVLMVAAAFETETRSRPLDEVCREALVLASSVATAAASAPPQSPGDLIAAR